MTDVALQCGCGRIKGRLRDMRPGAGCGSRIICYCKDCQTAARHLGAESALNDRGGSAIYQTTPAHVEITEGMEALACLRLSPKGLMRWYASCCNTPMFNTLAHAKLCFVGVVEAAVVPEGREALGPVTARTFTDSASGTGDPVRAHGFAKTGFGILRRHIGAKLRGSASMAPFFDAEGTPAVTPHILTLDERQAATPS